MARYLKTLVLYCGDVDLAAALTCDLAEESLLLLSSVFSLTANVTLADLRYISTGRSKNSKLVHFSKKPNFQTSRHTTQNNSSLSTSDANYFPQPNARHCLDRMLLCPRARRNTVSLSRGCLAFTRTNSLLVPLQDSSGI